MVLQGEIVRSLELRELLRTDENMLARSSLNRNRVGAVCQSDGLLQGLVGMLDDSDITSGGPSIGFELRRGDLCAGLDSSSLYQLL